MLALVLFLFLVLPHVTKGQTTNIETDSVFDKAHSHYKAHRFGEALKVIRSSLPQTKEGKAISALIQGFVFTDSISFDEGKKWFLRAREGLKGSDRYRLIARVHFGLGKGYYNAGQYPESIREFLQLEKLAISQQLKPDEKSANYYLAQDFQALNKVPISNRYARRSLQLSRELKDTASIVRAYMSLITNYTLFGVQEMNRADAGEAAAFLRASAYGDSALGLLAEIKDFPSLNSPLQRAYLYDSYAGAWFCKGDKNRQVKFRIKAFGEFQKAGDFNNACIVCNKIGDDFCDLGRFDSALHYLNKSVKLRKAYPGGLANSDTRNLHYSLYRANKGMKRYHESLEALEKYLEEDTRLNDNRNLDLQKLREEFEAEKTRLRIKTETEKARLVYEQKRNLYIASSGILLLVLIFTAWFLYYRFKTRKEREERNLKILLQNAELSALKAQMNPHFIFNALNSIQHSIVTNNTEDAYRFLSRFSRLIRHVLDGSAEQLIPLKTEVETLTLYLEIESRRFDHSFSFEVNAPAEVPEDELMVPPMILQPFVENAIWHGLMPKEGEKKLKVDFSVLQGKSILCTLADNGIGREAARKLAEQKGKTHRSKGIENIMDRARLLEMTHGIRVEINILDQSDAAGQPTGTKVEVLFRKLEKA